MINVLGKTVCVCVCIDTKEQFLREKKPFANRASGIPHRRIIHICQKPQLAKLNRNSPFHLIRSLYTIFSTCISTSPKEKNTFESLTFLKRNL